MSKKTRTFIAVEVVDEVHARALQAIELLRAGAENVKWVEPENLHWTLHFLGDLSDVEMAEVCRMVGKVSERHKPFAISAKGIGAFPKVERPRAMWLGAADGSKNFCALHEDLAEEMGQLGFRGESRRFVPHLTLGRVGRGSHGGTRLAEQVAQLADFDGGAMFVDQVTVYASIPSREGPTYHVLSHAHLSDGSKTP